jgi:hypothetical protein
MGKGGNQDNEVSGMDEATWGRQQRLKSGFTQKSR